MTTEELARRVAALERQRRQEREAREFLVSLGTLTLLGIIIVRGRL